MNAQAIEHNHVAEQFFGKTFQAMALDSPDAVLIVGADGYIVYSSHAAAELLGHQVVEGRYFGIPSKKMNGGVFKMCPNASPKIRAAKAVPVRWEGQRCHLVTIKRERRKRERDAERVE